MNVNAIVANSKVPGK